MHIKIIAVISILVVAMFIMTELQFVDGTSNVVEPDTSGAQIACHNWNVDGTLSISINGINITLIADITTYYLYYANFYILIYYYYYAYKNNSGNIYTCGQLQVR